MNANEIGIRLANLRKSKGLSQSQIAEPLFCSTIERGQPQKTLSLLCRRF